MIFRFNRYFNHKFFYIIFYFYKKIFLKKKKLKLYGENHGKYFLPNIDKSNNNEWIISAGVGDNISFDVEMLNLGFNVIFIDPTPLAIEYFKKNFDYNLYKQKYRFYEKGLWNEKTNLKFFYSDKKVISNTISNYNKSERFLNIETITIENIMIENDIKSFHIIKLDIEGAELEIVEYIFRKKIKPTYLLIEFDFLKQKNLLQAIYHFTIMIKKLKKLNFKIIYIDNLNFTFKRII